MKAFNFLTSSQNVFVRKAEIFLRSSSGLAGGAVYGPYISVPKGGYSVYWKIELDDETKVVNSLEPAVRFDVTCDKSTVVLSEKTFSLVDIEQTNGFARIDFVVPPGGAQNVEFRAFLLGVEGFSISLKRQVRDSGGGLFFDEPDLFEFIEGESVDPTASEFIAANFANLSRVHDWGAKLTISGKGVCATFKGIKVFLRNEEDFQVFGEVFVLNSYDAEMSDNFVVADVGMNIGFASLRFASLKGVAEVHSFEPFKAPFTRAVENFTLNPKINAKIFPNNFGLFGSDSRSKVVYNENYTIGTSVRGLESHNSEAYQEVTIDLREASSILGQIIAKAKARGYRFLLKLDCEGSEFPIIENLSDKGLLKEVDVILMEWHKWWDQSKTQRVLIEPLLRNDFLILDRTRDDDPHAGFITAVRLS
jgi:FkbM family methyltransferase